MGDLVIDELRLAELLRDAAEQGARVALAKIQAGPSQAQWLTPSKAARIYRRRLQDVLDLIDSDVLRAQRVPSRGRGGLGWRIDPQEASRVLGAPYRIAVPA